MSKKIFQFAREHPIILPALFALTLCFIFVDRSKPLQMDELSTFFHCHDKSFSELVEATEVGVDWMPLGYFAMIWAIDQTTTLNQTMMRLPNLLFVSIAFILIYKVLHKTFGKAPANIGVMTMFTHSLHTPFLLTEARTYAMYLFLGAWLMYAMVKAIEETSERKFNCGLFLVNFLCPACFYIGGVYCATALLSFLVFALINKQKTTAVISSCLAGWLTFFLLCIPTLLKQMQETYTGINSTSTNLQDLFTLYGTQVYFPLFLIVALTCTLIFPTKKSNGSGDPCPLSLPTTKLLLILSSLWLLTPLVFFLTGKALGLSFIQARYFTPNLLAMATIIALFASLFFKFFKPQKIVTVCYALACLCFLGVNSNSLAKAYAAESPSEDLSFLEKEDAPVITLSMRVAFHVGHYHSNETYFLVGDEKYATYMHKFSKRSNPIALNLNGSSICNTTELKEEFRLIFISGPMGSSTSFDIKAFAKSNGYQIRKTLPLDSPEATFAHYLERKGP